jgi:hypothetical protein
VHAERDFHELVADRGRTLKPLESREVKKLSIILIFDPIFP